MILNGLKYQKYTSENELQVFTCLYMVYITGWLLVSDIYTFYDNQNQCWVRLLYFVPRKLIWRHDTNQGEKSWGVEE